MKKSSESSPRERLVRVNADSMSEISESVRAQMEALTELPDEDIDLSDIPEQTNWDDAVRGKFYRPIKKPVTLRLDSDVLAWFKSKGPGYQTRINSTLRRAMQEDPQSGQVPTEPLPGPQLIS